VVGYIPRWFTCEPTVTQRGHPSSNRAQYRVRNFINQDQRVNHYITLATRNEIRILTKTIFEHLNNDMQEKPEKAQFSNISLI